MSVNSEAEELPENRLQQMARARYWTLAAIDKAQGNVNPHDLPAVRVAWHEAVVDFADELRQLCEHK